MYQKQHVPLILVTCLESEIFLVTRLVSEICLTYFSILLHEKMPQCFYYFIFNSNYHYYCDPIHGEFLPPFQLLGKDAAYMENTAHQLKSLCLLTLFNGELWLCLFLYEQQPRRVSNKNTVIWLFFCWQLRRTKKIWIETRMIVNINSMKTIFVDKLKKHSMMTNNSFFGTIIVMLQLILQWHHISVLMM